MREMKNGKNIIKGIKKNQKSFKIPIRKDLIRNVHQKGAPTFKGLATNVQCCSVVSSLKYIIDYL